tara:strand:- start:66 stop:683 length:618 start_codon:yes stop_codon:yes gene_type:complete
MSFSKSKLFKKSLFLKSAILIFGSISLAKPVFPVPVEFTCQVNGSYGVNNRMVRDQNGKKFYPPKLAKNVSEEFEKFKVIFDINKGQGTINGSDAEIISSKISKDITIRPIIGPVVLYSSVANFKETRDSRSRWEKRERDYDKRYLMLDRAPIFDKGNRSKFTLIDSFDNAITDITLSENKFKSSITEKNILHEIYYGICYQPKN